MTRTFKNFIEQALFTDSDEEYKGLDYAASSMSQPDLGKKKSSGFFSKIFRGTSEKVDDS